MFKSFLTYKVWMFIDVSIGVPIFINLFAILLLTPKFLSLLRDYRARYMNIGETDLNFEVHSMRNSHTY